ncbi:hypothetical protein KSF78_0002837 [Schistosoma japonicum]|nr:hypothetical protein KSF78_0002837 [Schistosoma japonicum]
MENVESRFTDKKYVLDACLKLDEAEEGEVNDLSDQEENISDLSSDSCSEKLCDNSSSQLKDEGCLLELRDNEGSSLSALNAPSTHPIRTSTSSPLRQIKTNATPKQTNASPTNSKSNVHGQSSLHENQATTKLHSVVNHTKPSVTHTSLKQVDLHVSMSAKSNNLPQGLRNLEKMQLQMQLEVTANQNECDLVSTAYSRSSQPTYQIMFPGFVPGGTSTQPQNPAHKATSAQTISESNNSDNRFVLPGSWQVAAPPSSALGSQQEIEKMHMMYQKACQLYQRAVATIGSTPNVNIQPPPFGTAINSPPHTSLQSCTPTLIPATVVECSTSWSPSRFISASHPCEISRDIVPNQCISQNSHLAAMIPNHAQSPSMQTTYMMAYSSAYQETLRFMSSNASISLVPNTPEYTSQWHRYFNHYLNYYLQAHSCTPTLPSDQQPVFFPPTGLPPPPNNTFYCANDPVLQNKVDVHSHHDSKRPRLSSSESHNVTTLSHPKHSSNSGSLLDAKNVASDGSKNDLSSSRYLWISNLPQGVRAVDIKEMCAPYEKVQTIKIVGSKKNKPPSIYAYLIMETSDAAVRLLKALQGVKLSDNELKIKQINPIRLP